MFRQALSRRSLSAGACGFLAVAAVGSVLSACGGGQAQDANEPSGNFPVQAAAKFPRSQRLAQHSRMVLVVHNTGSKTIPNVAVTICNVTCAYNAPRGTGSSAGAFAANISQEGVANPSRPIWIVDTPPKPCTAPTCNQGGAGGAVTAYSNTWALGPLQPGHTRTFDWGVTAVKAGKHVVQYQVAAGLNGKARAVLPGGGRPWGTFKVTISSHPERSYVNNSGQIVKTK